MELAVEANHIIDLELPYIPEGKRIIPNDLIRSSLFCVSNHNCLRPFYKSKQLYSFKSTYISYSGEELRQDDEDVWLQLIYLACESQSSMVSFRPYTFLKQIHWPDRTQYRDKLKESLTRLSTTTVEIFNKDFEEGIAFSLVRKFKWKDGSDSLKKWEIWIEPEIVNLFKELGRMYTKIHWEQRMSLKPLAKWLHAFYSSHSEPEPVFILKLLQLSGSKTKDIRHFKETLINSLKELMKVGFLTDAYIDKRNYLHVSRKQMKYKSTGFSNDKRR